MNITLPTVNGSQTVSGEMPADAIGELRKALEAGYGTDVSALTGGSALRIQSLDKTMMSTIQENSHFALFNLMAKANAGATVDEWTEQSSVGGFLGGSTNTETGSIASAQGQYARRVGMVKYLMTRREVSFVMTLGNQLADAEAVEQQNGALQLLTDAEYLSFEGDSAVVPTEFDGIYAQMVGLDSVDHIIDAGGVKVDSIHLINKAAATIAGYGNFGTPTHIFLSQLSQADFDNGLDPAFRVPLNDVPGGGTMIGAPVVGVRTSYGNIKNVPDVFIRDEILQQPFEIANSALATANAASKPATVTPASPGADAASKFAAGHAGTYYYAVAGVNASGQSAVTISSQVTIDAGESVSIEIARSSGSPGETGYVIYRSRKNGGNSVAGSVSGEGSDFREVGRVAYAGATTTWVDQNRSIPGTSKAFILNMATGANAITWRQLLPMLKFPLYPTVSATIPWAQLMFGYLRLAKRKHHVVIKNILPTGAVWRPFG